MSYITLGNLNQLQLQIPTENTKDWGTNLKDNFVIKLVEHDHSGNGKGAPLGVSSFADNVINDIKIRLRNDNYLRSRNGTNTGDVNLIKANASNNLVIGDNTASQVTAISSATTTVNALTVNGVLTIPAESIGSDEIEDESITVDKMADDSVGEDQLLDNSIPQSKLQDASVGTNELIDLNITTGKVANDAIDDTKVRLRNNQWLRGRNAANDADVNIVKVNASNVIEFGGSVTATPAVNSVGNTELQDNAVSQTKLQDNSVGTDEIKNLNVTLDKLASDSVNSSKIVDDSIIKDDLNSSSFDSQQITLSSSGTILVNSYKYPIKLVVLQAGVSAATIISLDYLGGKVTVINPTGGSLTVRILNNGNSQGVNKTIASLRSQTFMAVYDGATYKIISYPIETILSETIAP